MTDLPPHKKFEWQVGMLGNDQAGERAAAALKATELVRSRGLTWEDDRGHTPTRET